MTYNIGSYIKSVEDVKTFFHHIVSELKVNFHPDDMFEDYVSCEGGINTFTLGNVPYTIDSWMRVLLFVKMRE